jgi:malonyl-CoA decarboxylase
MRDIPDDIHRCCARAPKNGEPSETPTTAVFYSISNCQDGLRGISFGNFLIKQVVEELVKERGEPADLRDAVADAAVSPKWLARRWPGGGSLSSRYSSRERLGCWTTGLDLPPSATKRAVRLHCGSPRTIFLNAKNGEGIPDRPRGPLPPGQRRAAGGINWQGDISAKGTARGPRTHVQTIATS